MQNINNSQQHHDNATGDIDGEFQMTNKPTTDKTTPPIPPPTSSITSYDDKHNNSSSSSSERDDANKLNTAPKLLSFSEGTPEFAVQTALQKLMFDPNTSEGNTRK